MELKRVLRGIFIIFERVILNGTGLGGWKRLIIYLACISGGLGVIWFPLITFLKTSPLTYTTKWTLILPGAGVGSSINLESIGQAATAVSSPYTSPSLDPKVSYKQIVKSEAVLGVAAESIGMTLEEFGEPRIKLVAQTTLMYFSITGLEPEKTHARAVALIKALKDQLAVLRQDESERRVETAQLYIRGFEEKLHRIQEKLLAYQKKTNLISEDQFQDLAAAVAKMRQERAMNLAAYKKAEGQAAQLAGMLSTSPEMAADLLTLQSNPVFGEYKQAYIETQSKLTEYIGKWGANHPEVIKARQNAKQSRAAMLAHGESLIGYPLQRYAGLMELLLSESEAHRNQLLQELILADVTRHGIDAQIKAIDQSIAQLEARVKQTIDSASTLADLQLQHRVATAVLTTTLAQLDIGKADPFASYPLIQILEAPKVPSGPDTSKRKFALLGGVMGSVFIVIGLTISWKRQALFQRILKNV